MEKENDIQSEMLRKAGQGDGEAQAWLYRQYCKAMYNICLRMTGSISNAEDVLQDIFILAFKNLEQVKQADRFGGWLRTITVNECIRFCKRSVYWKTLPDDHLDSFIEEETDWWTNIDPGIVNNEIKNLPEGCRQVFVLYAVENYTHKEIAKSLSISESTSKSQYHRARQLLKDRITKQITIHG